MDDASMQVCPGCGGAFPPTVGGPLHRYMASSPGCWAMYGEVLAREYEQPSYFAAHRLTVDAYAVQHPGQPSPQSIQSVAIHLVGLCLVFEHGLSADRATAAMQANARRRTVFWWLDPPPERGGITVAEVYRAASTDEHVARVRAWAVAAWAAWAAHHETVRGWVRR